jgi:predicted dehydrogenase
MWTKFRLMTIRNPRPLHPSHRRRFLQTALGGGVTAIGFPAILSGRSPNSKLNVASIGVGGRGAANTEKAASENIVALCDIDANYLARAAENYPRARIYTDFRKLYDEGADIDAVIVSTTEHTHAVAVLPALKMGKHVFCEKPLTHNVREARILTEAAREARVATQMGTQIHAGENYRRVVELIRAGVIGPVGEVHVWVSRAWGRQTREEAEEGRDIVFVRERPPEAMPVPPGLEWDLWIGPAPFRPYHDVYLPGPKWYRWWDFGNGTMSDLGSHWIDLPFWALDLDAPLAIEAAGPPPHPEIAPATMSATYTYGDREGRPPLRLTWYQGRIKPPLWEEGLIPQWPNGVLFVGEGGMVLADYGKHILLPETQFVDFEPPLRSIPPSIGHHEEWIEACKNGSPTTCHFGYSGPMTEANHLGNVAYRAGQRLEWDARNLRIPNAPEAEALLGREYRDGWSLG